MEDWDSIPGESNDGNFSFRQCVHTGSGAHLTSYLMGKGGSFPGVKTNGAWKWQLTSIWCRG